MVHRNGILYAGYDRRKYDGSLLQYESDWYERCYCQKCHRVYWRLLDWKDDVVWVDLEGRVRYDDSDYRGWPLGQLLCLMNDRAFWLSRRRPRIRGEIPENSVEVVEEINGGFESGPPDSRDVVHTVSLSDDSFLEFVVKVEVSPTKDEYEYREWLAENASFLSPEREELLRVEHRRLVECRKKQRYRERKREAGAVKG